MAWFGQSMLHVVSGAGWFEAMGAEGDADGKLGKLAHEEADEAVADFYRDVCVESATAAE